MICIYHLRLLFRSYEVGFMCEQICFSLRLKHMHQSFPDVFIPRLFRKWDFLDGSVCVAGVPVPFSPLAIARASSYWLVGAYRLARCFVQSDAYAESVCH